MPALIERYQDNDSNSDSDDDDDVPDAARVQQATLDTGAPYAKAPLQGASQEELPTKDEADDGDELDDAVKIKIETQEEVYGDMPTLEQQDDNDSDSDNDEGRHYDANDPMPPLVERDYDSDSSDDSDDSDDKSDDDEDEFVKPKAKPVYSHNLRRNPKPSFKYNYGTNTNMLGKLDDAVYTPSDQFSSRYGHVFHILMTQMSATKWLKMFGERAENATLEELKQLVHIENVFEPKICNSLTAKQRNLALRAITLIKEKRDGKV